MTDDELIALLESLDLRPGVDWRLMKIDGKVEIMIGMHAMRVLAKGAPDQLTAKRTVPAGHLPGRPDSVVDTAPSSPAPQRGMIVTDTTAEALRRFRDRALFLCEQMTTAPEAAEADDLPEILMQEVAFLVEEGAESYIRYVQRMDQAAVRQQLDRELDEFLRDNT